MWAMVSKKFHSKNGYCHISLKLQLFLIMSHNFGNWVRFCKQHAVRYIFAPPPLPAWGLNLLNSRCFTWIERETEAHVCWNAFVVVVEVQQATIRIKFALQPGAKTCSCINQLILIYYSVKNIKCKWTEQQRSSKIVIRHGRDYHQNTPHRLWQV